MNHLVVYPGTFDPITNGHVDMILRAHNIFPQLLIAVAKNDSKRPFLSLEERVRCVQQAIGHLPGIQVMHFGGLLVDFAAQVGARVILRGVRAVADFDYECQLASLNRQLMADIETVFLTPSEKYRYISSTMVRDIAILGGDIATFVPDVVVKCYAALLSPK